LQAQHIPIQGTTYTENTKPTIMVQSSTHPHGYTVQQPAKHYPLKNHPLNYLPNRLLQIKHLKNNTPSSNNKIP